MSTNPFYTPSGNPQQLSRGASALLRAEFQSIANAFGMVASATGYNSAVDTGAPNAYVVNPTPALATVPQFSQLLVLVGAANANTGASTITVNGLGPFNITRRDGSALQPGDMPDSSVVLLYFDGAEYQLQGNSLAGNASGAISMNGNTLNLARANAIASAATLNLDGLKGNSGSITGTTTITAVTLAAGHIFFGTFAGSLTLTNGASLTLPGGANITTQAGDMAFFVGTGSGNVVVFYMPVSGYAINQAWAELASASFSGVAAVSYLSLFTSQYDNYRVELSNVTSDGTGSLEMQLAIAGSAYTGAYYFFAGNSVISSGANTAFGNVSQTSQLLTKQTPASNGATLGGSIDVFNALASGSPRQTVAEISYANTSGVIVYDASGGVIEPQISGAISGFKLILSSGGNFSGKIKVYGKQA